MVIRVKHLVVLIWTLFVVAFVVFVGKSTLTDKVYYTNIPFETSRTLQINAETVTFSATSSAFFALYNENGDYIIGLLKRPSGDRANEKFVAEPREISGGTWLFPVGSATITISSGKTMPIISTTNPDARLSWILLIILGATIWFLVTFAVIFEFPPIKGN